MIYELVRDTWLLHILFLKIYQISYWRAFCFSLLTNSIE